MKKKQTVSGIKKNTWLRLNKQTIAHLNYRQMTGIIGGSLTENDQNIFQNDPTETQQNCISTFDCPTVTTQDTGIPPIGGGQTSD